MKFTRPLFACLSALVLHTTCHALEAPRDLVISEGFTNPLGFHDATPTFSWKLPEGVARQNAWHIVVEGDRGTWDSGWVESDQSVFVRYGGEAFQSRDRASWKVRFRDQDGKESPWSETSTLELGLLSNNDWQAKWIRAAPHASGELEILEASYASRPNPELGVDVTETLRAAIMDGKLSLEVTDEAFGGNPAEKQPKDLTIVYRLDGQIQHAVFAEKSKAVLPHGDQNRIETVTTLRRAFPVEREVKHARLYITARGIFDLHLNGKRVSDDVFANGWTAYRKRIDTLAYDVTDLLKAGENAITARLGQGWYSGRLAWLHDTSWFSLPPELLLQLEITHTDGTVEKIVSDENWEGTYLGPMIASSFYDGEIYDARQETTGWQPVLVADSLGDANLTPKPFPATRPIETLPTLAITEPAPGRFVFDFGQNLVGMPKLKIPVVAGETITMRFAELINPDGTMYTENYRSAKSTNTYTAATTGVIEWEPTFTFHGYRYVELSGYPDGVKPEKDWVESIVLHTPMRRTGEFTSSHDMLNQLQSNIVWGQRGNFLDIPTDCPQRDERLGWTGDAQVFAATAMFNYDCHAFFKSWLGSMRDEQHPSGTVPNIIPNILGGRNSPGWQDAATIIPWDVYVRTGDLAVLSENYEMMEKLVGSYRKRTEGGLNFKEFAFGDWLQPHAKERHGDTPRDIIAAAFYAKSARILADSAKALGKTEDAERYTAEADMVASNFGRHFIDADGKLQNAAETQTGYILALEFKLVPDALIPKAAAHLARLVEVEAEGHLRTGFLGTPYIAPILERHDRADLAFGVLFKETYPSWFYSIHQGATTMWERWNSYSHETGFGDASMNSFNHYAYGAIGQWMVERIAGLAPDSENPGYKNFFVRPLPGGPLTSARADLETPYGKAASGWELRGDSIHLEIIVPPNTTATLEFPGHDASTNPLLPGRHAFTFAR